MERDFDFTVPDFNNGITYHAKFDGKKYILSWEYKNNEQKDIMNIEELHKYLNNGFWKVIKYHNLNRRIN